MAVDCRHNCWFRYLAKNIGRHTNSNAYTYRRTSTYTHTHSMAEMTWHKCTSTYMLRNIRRAFQTIRNIWPGRRLHRSFLHLFTSILVTTDYAAEYTHLKLLITSILEEHRMIACGCHNRARLCACVSV